VIKVATDEELLAMLEAEKKHTAQSSEPQPVEKTEAEIVPVGDEVYLYFDQEDEKQIINTLMGTTNPMDLVYQFADGSGRQVRGISWIGTKELVGVLEKEHGIILTIDDIKIIDAGDSYVALSRCINMKTGKVMFGGAEQPKKMKLKSGEFKEDLFGFAKCINKSQRNAYNNHIPESLKAKLIIEWHKRVHKTHREHP